MTVNTRRGQLSRCFLRGLLATLACCAPAKERAAVAPPAAQAKAAPLPCKRVDRWRFVDRELPLTAVELQLKQQFERVLVNAQFSEPYTCLAREMANFRDQYRAGPDESLEHQISGRCGAPYSSNWVSREFYSDGTLLDRPLSPEFLNSISADFSQDLPP